MTEVNGPFGFIHDRLQSEISQSTARIFFFLVLATLIFAPSSSALAQQPTGLPRIGWLSAVSSSANVTRYEAFRHGLRELGYVEGKNILIEWRSADGKPDRLRTLAAELAGLKVDLIVSGGSTATGAAKEATSSIPIIMSQDNDPVGNGFVISLARPGGNITGLATLRSELSGKRLELLKEILPNLSRLAVFGTSANPGNAQAFREIELTAAAFKVQLQYLDIRRPDDIETAFREARKGRADAVIVLAGPVFNAPRTRVIELAVKSRLPAIYDRRDFGDVGGLITYGVSVVDLDRRSATYVDKILKGANPAELAVEQPTKFELVINLKAAKQIGLTIPPNVLARADRVIR